MTKRRHYTSIFLLLFTSLVLAQNPHPYFRNYTTDDGLPSPEVHYCLEDNDGYMWFATDNGVSRFDGYEFKNYGPREGLKDPVVFYLQKDSKGTIWMATMSGLLYYWKEDHIYPFEQNYLIEERNHEGFHINDFYIDDMNTKYLSIKNIDILKFQNGKPFEWIKKEHEEVDFFAKPIENRWMIGGNFKSVAVKNKIHNRASLELLLPNPQIISISNDLKSKSISNSRWIYQFESNKLHLQIGDYLYELVNNQITWSQHFPFNVPNKSVHKLSNGQILIGTVGKRRGLYLYKNINHLKNNQYQYFLAEVSVSQIFKDGKGGFWFASLENGVFYCQDFQQKIYDQSMGLTTDNVMTFDFKNEDELFIGSRDGYVFSLDESTNLLNSLPLIQNRDIVYELVYLSQFDELWATTGSLFWFKNGQWEGKKNFNNNFTSGKKMTLSKDQSLIWTAYSGGFGATKISDKKVHLNSVDSGYKTRSFRVWEDQQERIWVANINGLFEFKYSKLIRPQPFFSAFRVRAEDISELADSTLVIGTKGEGVLFWKDSLFQQVTVADGLSSDMIENVYIDSSQNIWVGTLKGLNKITRRDTSFVVKVYSIFHGLPSNEINQVKVRGDEVWIATTKGLIKWKEPLFNTESKKPVIDKILVNNKSIDLLAFSNLEYWENNIEFYFTTINFRSQGKIKYRYRLNEANWNATYNRSVNFANLSPSSYRFEVQSQNENQIWSLSTVLEFEIQPPFYQTNWFFFLGMISLVFLSWFFYNSQINKFKKEEALKLQMNELRNSALRAQMNPHFIFNCLNSIQNLIQQDDKENASLYLIRFAKMIRSTLNASTNNLITVEEEIQHLENYLKLEQLRFKDKFEYHIDIDPSIDQYEIELPSMLIQTYVENAIQHGFAEWKKNGKINIQFYKKDNQLEIQIEDNGIGFFQSQQMKETDRKLHRSLGMNISQKRLSLLDAANTVNIQELKNKDGTIGGTLVTLRIHLD